MRRALVALMTTAGLALAAAPAQAAVSITADPACVASVTDGFAVHVSGMAPGQAFQLYVASPLVLGLTDSNGLELADASGRFDSGLLWTDLGFFGSFFPQGGTYTVGAQLYDLDSASGFYVYSGVDVTSGRFTVSASCSAPPADTTPPTIAIVSPADGASFLLGQPVSASYACADPESTVTSCAGPIASGAALDTSTPGPASFRVDAMSAGGSSSRTDGYAVVYRFSGFEKPILDGASVNYGRSLPLRFALADYAGTSIGSAVASLWNGTTRLATFAYDPLSARYVANVSTKALPGPGTYALSLHLDDGTQHPLHLTLR